MSTSLLISKYLNKLDVNRLQVNQLKTNEVLPKIDSETKSYLYSLVLNNAQFKKVEKVEKWKKSDYNAELTISVSEQLQEVIQFTDRPFIQSSKIGIQQFVKLFLLKGPDSFVVDPPNVVLLFNNTQKSYTMSLASELNDKVVFNLKLLDGEEHTQENFTGIISMFVDDNDNVKFLVIKEKFDFSNISFTGYFEQFFNLYYWGLPRNYFLETDKTGETIKAEFYINNNKLESEDIIKMNFLITSISNNNTDNSTIKPDSIINCLYNFTIKYNNKLYDFTKDNIRLKFDSNNNTLINVTESN